MRRLAIDRFTLLLSGLLPVLLVMVLASPALAQDADPHGTAGTRPDRAAGELDGYLGAVEELADALKEAHQVPGVAVGVASPDGDTILTLGTASTTRGTSVTRDTRFEVGSITKLFTGLLLADMAVRGELALDDPVSTLLPAGVEPPTRDGREPTLRELSSHMSGLPRLPGNLMPADMQDPYAGYTTEAMYEFVSGLALPGVPGESFEYSNLGVGLLGDLLTRRAGASYAGLLEDRVTGPLGLDRTHVPTSDNDDTAAEGHVSGEVVPYWHMDALKAAGEVRSTPADMLRFVRAQLDPAGTPLEETIRLTQETVPAVDQLSMGLGWHVVALPDGREIYFHNGGTGGFRSFAGFVPGTGVGLVVLANAAFPLEAIDQAGVQMLMAVLQAQ